MKFLPISAIIVIVDFIVKRYVVNAIEPGGVRQFIPYVLSLTCVRNFGVSFSLLSDSPYAMLLVNILASAVSIALVVLLVVRKFPSVRENIALSLILAGAVGNLVDRLRLGYVVDMFMTEFVDFAIFNVADIALTIGTALLIWEIIRTAQRNKIR